MVKKKNRELESVSRTYVLLMVVALLVVGLVLFSFYQKVEIFKVNIFDEEEVLVFEQSVYDNKGSNFFQSFFSFADMSSFLMQSSVPLDKDKKFVIIEALVSVPDKNGVFRLDRVEYRNNDELINVRGFSEFFFDQDDSFKYSSEPIHLKGNEAEKNLLKLDFFFVSDQGEEFISEFVYEYLFVTRCETDDDCPGRAPVCDRSNAARFAVTSGVHYCVRPCGAHSDCAPGQICIVGVCGY